MNSHYWKLSACLFCGLALASGRALESVHADQPLRLAHRWEVEPDLGIDWLPSRKMTPEALHPERFARDQLQIVLDEAQHAMRHASSEQLEGREAALEAILQRPQLSTDNRQVRLALAGAAIALADAANADLLWQRFGQDAATQPLVERALTEWKSPQAIELWRERLQAPATSLHDLHLAAVGIGAVGNQQDGPALQSLLRSDRLPIPAKIVVARSLGQLMDHDLEKLASEFLSTHIAHRELLAAELLSKHTSPQASQILQTVLAADHQPARVVSYAAISRNYADLGRDLAEQMLNQPDNNLRAQAVDVLNQHDDVQSLRLQAQRIVDRNYAVRTAVRSNLQQKAQIESLKPVVDEVIDEQLSGDDYRGIEQAILLSVDLGETRCCPAYLKLLEYPRPETSLLAAWALQELAHTPELMQGILEQSQSITERLQSSGQASFPEQLRQAFLFEALGRNRYQPALAALKLYIPKQNNISAVCRASAIWAIGKIQEDSHDQKLASVLAQRMLDESIILPEDPLVQFTSTLALGWIKAPGSLEQFSKPRTMLNDSLVKAAQWSIEQLK